MSVPSDKFLWLTQSFAIGSDKPSIWEILRAAVTVPVVLGVAIAYGGPQLAIYASLGALLVVLGERPGTTGQRMFKVGAGLVAGLVSMALGPYTAGSGMVPLLVVAAFALVSGVLSAYGPALSFAGLQLLVQMAIAGGLQTGLDTRTRLLAYLCGGVAALAGAWVLSASERTDRLYGSRLADTLVHAIEWKQSYGATSAPGHDEGMRVARWKIDQELAQASDLILTMRPQRLQRKALQQQLIEARDQVSMLVSRLFSGVSCAPGVIEQALDTCRRLASGRAATGARVAVPASTRLPAVAKLAAAPWKDPAAWHFIVRLTTCMVIGEAIRQWTSLGHSYWILLTVALALKPDMASVFSRSLQRGAGTIVGILLAFAVTRLADGRFPLVFVALLGAGIPYSVRRNYAWFSVLITPIVVILLDLAGATGTALLVQRLVHTVTGCLVVLVFGYALWPATWRPTARREIADLCDALAGLLERRLAKPADDGLAIANQRLSIARGIASLRSRATAARGEPALLRAKAEHWLDVTDRLDDLLIDILRYGSIDEAAAAGTLRVIASTLRSKERAAIHALAPVSGTSPVTLGIERLSLAIRSLSLYGQPERQA